MFCGHETANISQGEAMGSIGSRGSTKHTVSRKSISILLYTKCQRKQKETGNFDNFYLITRQFYYSLVSESNVHRSELLPREFRDFHVLYAYSRIRCFFLRD
jgi:hypothetical protein